jgi:hypothetical protein
LAQRLRRLPIANGNRFVIGEHGNRDEMCNRFVVAAGPDVRELTGKDLICSWAPHRFQFLEPQLRAAAPKRALCRPRQGHRLSAHHDGRGRLPCGSLRVPSEGPERGRSSSLHHARPAEHRRAAEFDQHQRLDRGLLLGKIRFLIRKAGDEARRVALGGNPDSEEPRDGCRFILRLG